VVSRRGELERLGDLSQWPHGGDEAPGPDGSSAEQACLTGPATSGVTASMVTSPASKDSDGLAGHITRQAHGVDRRGQRLDERGSQPPSPGAGISIHGVSTR
jgi:hypothetical protein